MNIQNEFGIVDNSLTALLERGRDEVGHVHKQKSKCLDQFYAEVPESIRQYEDKTSFSFRENDAVIAEFEVPTTVSNNTRTVRLRLISYMTSISPGALNSFTWSYGFKVFGSMHWTHCNSLEHALYAGATVDMSTPVIKLFGG